MPRRRGLARQSPGCSTAPLHLLELVDALDRVAVGHSSSSFPFPVSPASQHSLFAWERIAARVSRKRSGVTTRRGTTTTSTRSCRCTRRTWSSRTTPQGVGAGPGRGQGAHRVDLRELARPPLRTRRLYVRDGVVTQEWTAAPRTPTRCAEATWSPSPPARRSSGAGRRDPLRGRPDQAQGRLLGLRLDSPPGRPARLVEIRP